jgi:hypothetical protein
VFSRFQDELENDLQVAINGMDLDLVERYLNFPEFSEKDQKSITHIVVQYRIVGESFSKCELDFASEWIGEKIIEAKAKQDYKKLLAHYRSVCQAEGQGVYGGHLWEHLCHAIIPLVHEGGLKLEPLGKEKKCVTICKGKKLVVGKGKLADLKQILQKGEYFHPLSSNFPVIDSAVVKSNVVSDFK